MPILIIFPVIPTQDNNKNTESSRDLPAKPEIYRISSDSPRTLERRKLDSNSRAANLENYDGFPLLKSVIDKLYALPPGFLRPNNYVSVGQDLAIILEPENLRWI